MRYLYGLLVILAIMTITSCQDSKDDQPSEELASDHVGVWKDRSGKGCVILCQDGRFAMEKKPCSEVQNDPAVPTLTYSRRDGEWFTLEGAKVREFKMSLKKSKDEATLVLGTKIALTRVGHSAAVCER